MSSKGSSKAATPTPILNMESHTAQPETLVLKCEQIDIVTGKLCDMHIPHHNMKVIRANKITCINCYQNQFLKTEKPQLATISRKQFQRISETEHVQSLQSLTPDEAKLTERAATNPKRSYDQIAKGLEKLSEKKYKLAMSTTDYLATFANGFQGWYVCRAEAQLPADRVTRVILPKHGTAKLIEAISLSGSESDGEPPAESQRMSPMEVDSQEAADSADPLSGKVQRGEKRKSQSDRGKAKRAKTEGKQDAFMPLSEFLQKGHTCSDVIVPMNHWMRSTNGDYRCPINLCKYRPFAPSGGPRMGFCIAIHGPECVTFVPATPPEGRNQNDLALFKLLFNETDIVSLLHSQESLDDFWSHINNICQSEHAILSQRCAQVFIRTPGEVKFPIAESRASLGQDALGREIKGCLIEQFSSGIPAFGPEQWRKFIDGVFGHFTLSKVSEEMRKSLTDSQLKTLRKYDKPGEAARVTMEPAQVIQWLQERLPARE